MGAGLMGEVDRTLDETPEGALESPPPFSAGTTIGHFRIVRELGAGGMGRVFEAHDPDLGRRVAVKVVRDREADSAGSAQLIREAQAMARLTHPNVVAVHEVGTLAGQVFIVMELVRGATLAVWLEQRRPWRAIVEAMVQAGSGLVAAHHAGLVHRDFKPNNVLVDDAGRVRVTDFGLARADDDPHLAVGSDVAGTPAFMAPEQRAGEPVDARADQYAFAMSLQYALGEERAVGSAPRRIRAAIARGLAIDPRARFATLEDLIGELRAGLASRWKIAAAATIAAVLAGGAAVAWAARPAEPEDACTASTALADEIWTPGARGQVIAALIAQRPRGAPAIAASAHLVDDWVAAWKLGRRAACGLDGEPRAARLGCLDQGLHDLRAQVAVWLRADGEVVDRAVDAAAALASPSRCTTARPEAPVDPALREHFANIAALERSGRPREAQPDVDKLLALAEADGRPEQRARAYYAAGGLARQLGQLDRARDYLARAAAEAGRAGMDEHMVDALMVESSVVIDQGRPLDSLGILDAAGAIVARLHSVERSEDFALARGDALIQAGRIPEGTAELERALAMLEARAARDPSAKLQLARSLGVLAGAYGERFEWQKAHDLLVRCLAIEEAAYGPLHPEVGRTLHDLATNANRLGKFTEGIAMLERARRIFVSTYGEHHLLVGDTDISLSLGATLEKRYDAARRYMERAQATLSTILPANHPHLANIESGLGSIDREQDRCAAAIPHFERALAILDQVGRAGTEQANGEINLGACLTDVKRYAEARPHVERSLALYDEAHVPERDKSESWAMLADIEDAAGHSAKARALRKHVLETVPEDDAEYAEIRSYVRDKLSP